MLSFDTVYFYNKKFNDIIKLEFHEDLKSEVY